MQAQNDDKSLVKLIKKSEALLGLKIHHRQNDFAKYKKIKK